MHSWNFIRLAILLNVAGVVLSQSITSSASASTVTASSPASSIPVSSSIPASTISASSSIPASSVPASSSIPASSVPASSSPATTFTSVPASSGPVTSTFTFSVPSSSSPNTTSVPASSGPVTSTFTFSVPGSSSPGTTFTSSVPASSSPGTTVSSSVPPSSSPATTLTSSVPATSSPATITFSVTTTTSVPTTPPSGTPTPSFQINPNGMMSKCLDVQGGIIKNGTPVQIYDCNGTPAQNWIIAPGEGHVKLADTNHCLDAGSTPGFGTRMKIWECFDNLPAQDWFYTDDHRIALTNQGFCLDLVNGILVNQNPVQIWKCTDLNTNQIWTLSNGASSPA